MDSDLQIIKEVVGFLDERKAEDIVTIDLRQHANIADYFIIATGANKPHLKALYDGLQRLYKNAGFKGYNKEGIPDSGWMIMDYHGVMVHIFERELREFYDLEKLWKDAPVVELEGMS
ncbi:MAG: ribosome silencing factor [Kiritimatiellales bacterium]|nr:ribosome silencing factor [Pontiella sp.]NNJ69970.1 ribosome silencing factor [Kiritimatiellales bacterium]